MAIDMKPMTVLPPRRAEPIDAIAMLVAAIVAASFATETGSMKRMLRPLR